MKILAEIDRRATLEWNNSKPMLEEKAMKLAQELKIQIKQSFRYKTDSGSGLPNQNQVFYLQKLLEKNLARLSEPSI